MDDVLRIRWRTRFLAIVGVVALLAAGLPIGLGGPATVNAGPASGPPTITTFWLTNVTQTQATFYFETDQPAEGYLEYGATFDLGRVRPRSTPPQQTQHTIIATNLSANTLYYYRAKAVNEFGEDKTETFTFRTPAASSTAKLIVTKVNSDQATLAGACFAVFRNA